MKRLVTLSLSLATICLAVSCGNLNPPAEEWEVKLCEKVAVAFVLNQHPLPSYVETTCSEIIHKGKSGAKWRNEARQCARYDGLALVRCIQRDFK